MWSSVAYAIAAFHLTVIFGNSAAFFVLPFKVPWYVALPCCSTIIYLGFTRTGECPLTTLENHFRRRAQLPEVRGFLGYYVVRPARKALGVLWRTSSKGKRPEIPSSQLPLTQKVAG